MSQQQYVKNPALNYQQQMHLQQQHQQMQMLQQQQQQQQQQHHHQPQHYQQYPPYQPQPKMLINSPNAMIAGHQPAQILPTNHHHHHQQQQQQQSPHIQHQQAPHSQHLSQSIPSSSSQSSVASSTSASSNLAAAATTANGAEPITSMSVYMSLLCLAESFQQSGQYRQCIHCLESILILKPHDLSVVMNFHIQLRTRLNLCRLYLKHTVNTNQYVNAHLEKSIILVQNVSTFFYIISSLDRENMIPYGSIEKIHM